MSVMKGITIKLPAATLRRLQQESRETGQSVAALIRTRVEAMLDRGDQSVHSLTSDLAGSVTGGQRSATNGRRRFRRS